MFHTLANNEVMKNEVDSSNYNFDTNRNNYLKRAWWWHIFCYFERNVPHSLPHKFSWPIPKRIQDSRPIQYIQRKFGSDNSTDSGMDGSRNTLLPSRPVVGYSSMHNTTSQGE